MNGIDRIAQAFQAARQAGRAALMPYLTLGFPDPGCSVQLAAAIAGAGADLLELGMPFSDPLADGPVIQQSTQAALQQGMTMAGCLEQVRQLRSLGISQPLLLMGYYNPLLAYGAARFVEDAAQAGADGLILPDLPPEEAGELEAACRRSGLAQVYLAPPNASPQRLALLAQRTSGFLYLVSVQGVTGVRSGLPQNLEDFAQRARAVARTPLAVGFGIASPEQAAAVGKIADGVIVGSVIIRTIAGHPQDPVTAVQEVVSSLAAALKF